MYTGITTDLEKRLKRHNEGRAAKYTRARKPVKLVYIESCINKSAALKREIDIKKLSHDKKVELIQSFGS